MEANQIALLTTVEKPGLARYPRLGQFAITTVRDDPGPRQTMDTPAMIASYWQDSIGPGLTAAGLPWQDRESMVVVCLDTRRRCLGWHIISTGGLDTCMCHPREVFRAVLIANASAFILAHNHPSGDPTPSEADIRATLDIMRAAQMLKVDLLDHVIIGDAKLTGTGHGYVSLRELGYFYA